MKKRADIIKQYANLRRTMLESYQATAKASCFLQRTRKKSLTHAA